MTGIMSAIAGNAQNIVYASGLYGPTGVDQAPINGSDLNNSVVQSKTWIGYFRPTAGGSNSFGISAAWTSDDTGEGQYSRAYVWVGALALSGYTTGNALAAADNSSGSGSATLVAGQYYPIRVQWNYYFPFDGGFFGFDTSGSFSLTPPSGTYWYNTKSNGF
jgi:hypothetical protein